MNSLFIGELAPCKKHFSITSLFMFVIANASVLIAVDAAFASPYPSVDKNDLDGDRVYSPFVGRNYPDEVLFGNTHFHTNLSFDAGLVGTTLDVDVSYRFAKGEKVISNSGQSVQLARPLDFLVITDHAEFIGLAPMIHESHPELLVDPWGYWVHKRFHSGPEGRLEAYGNIIEHGVRGENPFQSEDIARSFWIDFVNKAENYNEPGRFSAMTGFEWTSTPRW